MNRTTGQRLGLLLSIAVGLVPFAFAALRFLSTGTDLRALWMAIAALIGVQIAFAVGKASDRPGNVALGRAIVAAIAGACFAALAVWLLGTRGIVGILMVSLAFGVCFSASRTIAQLARPRSMT